MTSTISHLSHIQNKCLLKFQHLFDPLSTCKKKKQRARMGSIFSSSNTREEIEMALAKAKQIVTSNPVVVFRSQSLSFIFLSVILCCYYFLKKEFDAVVVNWKWVVKTMKILRFDDCSCEFPVHGSYFLFGYSRFWIFCKIFLPWLELKNENLVYEAFGILNSKHPWCLFFAKLKNLHLYLWLFLLFITDKYENLEAENWIIVWNNMYTTGETDDPAARLTVGTARRWSSCFPSYKQLIKWLNLIKKVSI